MEGAFLLEPGLEEGVFRDFGGCGRLDSVEACSTSTTGEACLGVVVSDPFMGEPSGEDTISSITIAPVWRYWSSWEGHEWPIESTFLWI